MRGLLLIAGLAGMMFAQADEISVALLPWVPDLDAYKKALVTAWTKAGETDTIRFADWDCFSEAYPTNVDVTVHESGYVEDFVKRGLILPLEAPEASAFPKWAVDGGAVDGKVYGYPQMLCTHFTFTRGDKPVTATACEHDLERRFPEATKGMKVFAYEAEMKERADWLAAAEGRALIDYSETMKLMPRALRDTVRFTPYEAKDCRYYVNYVSVSASCAESRRAAAGRLAALLVSRDYLSSALWPKDGEPQYILPARNDVFADFAVRDAIYGRLLKYAQRADNRTMR